MTYFIHSNAMIQNRPEIGSWGANAAVLRPTRERVRLRTIEIAGTAGRKAHQIMQADYEQAKRELTGETDFDRQQAVLNQRW